MFQPNAASDLVNFILTWHALALFFILVLCFIATRLHHGRKRRRFPELNVRKGLGLSGQRAAREFALNSRGMIVAARARYPDQPYKLICDLGELVVIPPRLIDEVGSNPDFDFASVAVEDSHGYIPGFEPFNPNRRFKFIVTKYLTKSLTKLTAPISEEATKALQMVLTDSEVWHEVEPQKDFSRIVSQMSTRVFMGEELCQDQDWVKISGEYTLLAFQITPRLLLWPRWMRPIVHWLMPDCWNLRSKLRIARRLLAPHIEKRRILKKEALISEQDIRFNDALEWFDKETNNSVDPATSQISLSLVAIHTTGDLLLQVMLDLASHTELIEPLRREIIEVLSAQGLQKAALYNLKLMDSVIKESQRIKPLGLALLRRGVLNDVKLSDGTMLYKGEKLVADTVQMWSPPGCKNGDEYDGFRYLRMRESSEEAKNAHLVRTSPGHFGFGHGLHACPGRFFAANELKIALCHLLLKYDWKLPEGVRPKPMAFGMALLIDPTAKLLVRRRREELDFSSLKS